MLNKGIDLSFELGKDDWGNIKYCDISKVKNFIIGGGSVVNRFTFLKNIISSISNNFDNQTLLFLLYGNFDLANQFKDYNFNHYKNCLIKKDLNKDLSVLQKKIEQRLKLLEQNKYYSYLDYYKNKSEMNKHFPILICIFSDLYFYCQNNIESINKFLEKYLSIANLVGMYFIFTVSKISSKTLPGILRANILSRIAFKTDNAKESKFLIDEGGAENLGNSELLFLEQGMDLVKIKINHKTGECIK